MRVPKRIKVAQERHPSSQWCNTSFSLLFGSILSLDIRNTPPSIPGRRVVMLCPRELPRVLSTQATLFWTYYPIGTRSRHPHYFKGCVWHAPSFLGCSYTTVGSIIFLSKYCPLPMHKDYFIVNPFIKSFSHIGIISLDVLVLKFISSDLGGFCTDHYFIWTSYEWCIISSLFYIVWSLEDITTNSFHQLISFMKGQQPNCLDSHSLLDEDRRAHFQHLP